MRCPQCGADRPHVVSTRRAKNYVTRIRRCQNGACNHFWETIEVILTDKVRRQVKEGAQLNLLDLIA